MSLDYTSSFPAFVSTAIPGRKNWRRICRKPISSPYSTLPSLSLPLTTDQLRLQNRLPPTQFLAFPSRWKTVILEGLYRGAFFCLDALAALTSNPCEFNDDTIANTITNPKGLVALTVSFFLVSAETRPSGLSLLFTTCPYSFIFSTGLMRGWLRGFERSCYWIR